MKSLLETLDEAAEKLLERATRDDNVSLGESVKVFEATMKWAELKLKLTPPPEPDKKEANGFEHLRRKFHANGRKAERRAPAADTESAEDSADEGDPFAAIGGTDTPPGTTH